MTRDGSSIRKYGTYNPRRKRTDNYWEPIYSPDTIPEFEGADLDFSDDTNVQQKRIFIGSTGNLERSKTVFRNVTFEDCDFEGELIDVVAFVNCNFRKCDFGYTSWTGTRFKNCSFHRVSFSLASFKSCDFRCRDFQCISFSGNETTIDNCSFTNPKQFVSAAFRYWEASYNGQSHTVDAAESEARLTLTKATIARSIFISHAKVGDEGAYYEALSVYQNLTIDARLADLANNFRREPSLRGTVSFIAGFLQAHADKTLTNIAGSINCWGMSVGRPFGLGLFIVAIYGVIYSYLSVAPTLGKAFLESLEITVLVGYTKYATLDLIWAHQVLLATNMIVGLAWYAVFIPTVISRISRVR